MNIDELCNKLLAAIKTYEERANKATFKKSETAKRIKKIKYYLNLLRRLLEKETDPEERLVLEGKVLMLTSAMLQSSSSDLKKDVAEAILGYELSTEYYLSSMLNHPEKQLKAEYTVSVDSIFGSQHSFELEIQREKKAQDDPVISKGIINPLQRLVDTEMQYRIGNSASTSARTLRENLDSDNDVINMAFLEAQINKESLLYKSRKPHAKGTAKLALKVFDTKEKKQSVDNDEFDEKLRSKR